MTKTEVISLVGQPKDIWFWSPNIKVTPTEERWILHFSPTTEKILSCVFNTQNNQLIRIEIVDSDYLF